MKVQINQSVLIGAIESAMSAIPSKPTTPIIGCIIIDTYEENRLEIKSTDASLSIYQIIDADIEESGTVAIPAKILKDTISSLKGELTLEYNDDYLVISHDTGQCRLMTNTNLDEFPLIERQKSDGKYSGSITMPSLKLKTALDATLYGASTDETKLVLTGVNFSINKTNLFTTTTDGHRIARVGVNLDKNDKVLESTIPAKALTEIKKILEKAPENNECYIEIFDNIVEVKIPNIKMITRVLDGQYPSIDKLFPTQFNYEFTVERKAFIETLKRVSNLADDKNKTVSIAWDINNCNAIVRTESSLYGDAHDVINMKPQAINNQNLDIGFNIDYLKDAVNAVTTDEIVIKCNHPMYPVVICPIGGLLDQSALVMPLQIRGNSSSSNAASASEDEINDITPVPENIESVKESTTKKSGTSKSKTKAVAKV